MTMRQKKRIRAALLTLLFLLLAMGTFDSRHGNLAAQAESRDIVPDGHMKYWRAEANFPAEKLAAAHTSPQTSPKAVVIEKVVKVEKIVEKEMKVMVEIPVEVEKGIKAAEYVPAPERVKPAPIHRELPDNGADDSHLVKKHDPFREPEPKPDIGVESGSGDEPGSGDDGDSIKGHGSDKDSYDPDPGDDGDGNKGHGSDKDGYDEDPGDDGDGNKGHGNDEDGFDEDNPGRGGFGGVGSSRGRNGSGVSGGSGERGKSGDSGGRGKSGGSGGRGKSGGRGGSKGRG